MQKEFGTQRKIILTGVSMGASTVLIAAGEKLPENVIGVLADCGYSNAKEIICSVIRSMKLPPKLLYPFVKLGAKLYGKFDLDLTTHNDFHHQVFAYYNLLMYYPESMDIVLKPRTDKIDGSPFFAGKVSHTMTISGNYENAVIELPGCIGTVELFIDGKSIGEKYFSPYRFNAGKISGEHTLTIVSDTPLTGFFEEFRTAFGPQSDPVIFEG
jgi:hypothetical protein